MTVTPNFKDNQGTCGCGCGAYGTLKKPWRDGVTCVARRCKCKRCEGKANRKRGDDKAAKVRKQLGLGGANTRHEELWGGPVRVESKSGGIARPVVTAHLNARAQSEAARAVGDHRPFLGAFTGTGSQKAIYTIGADELEAVVFALAEAWGYGEAS